MGPRKRGIEADAAPPMAVVRAVMDKVRRLRRVAEDQMAAALLAIHGVKEEPFEEEEEKEAPMEAPKETMYSIYHKVELGWKKVHSVAVLPLW